MIVSKILGIRNQKLSALRYLNGIVLYAGGATDICISRLQRTKDSVTPQRLRIKLTEISRLTPHLMKDWDKPCGNSNIFYDNVNPYVKPRAQTCEKGISSTV